VATPAVSAAPWGASVEPQYHLDRDFSSWHYWFAGTVALLARCKGEDAVSPSAGRPLTCETLVALARGFLHGIWRSDSSRFAIGFLLDQGSNQPQQFLLLRAFALTEERSNIDISYVTS
jgi:hypothetical protein